MESSEIPLTPGSKNNNITLGGAISETLDRLEVLVGKIGMNTPEQSIQILTGLDSALENISHLEGKISHKTAESQFEDICSQLHSHSRQFIKDLGGTSVLRENRNRVQPPTDHWWWYLDELIEKARKARLRHALFGLIGVVLALGLVILVYNLFLAPDPVTVAIYSSEQSTRDLMMQGDLDGALIAVDKGLEVAPSEGSLLTLKAIIFEEQKKSELSTQIMDKAAKSFSSVEEFLQTRGQAYMLIGRYEKALADVDEILRMNPQSAEAYLLSGQIYELKQDYSKAFEDFGMAFDLADAQNKSHLAGIARIRMASMLEFMGNPQIPTLTPLP